MALQIWLPLDGNFNNQGTLKDLNFTTSGTIQDIDGKIGKAKHFATGMAKAPLAYTLGNEFSFACWVYYDSFRSDNEWIFEIANSTSGYEKAVFGIASGESKKKIVLCLGGTVNRTTVHEFVVNTWYHIVFTWDGTTAKVYKNGELLNSFAMTKGSVISGTNISIGSNVANSNTKLSGRLNDIRVYNHCLSIREIKELAKGLVLHYKLNKIIPNLMPNSYSMPYGTSNPTTGTWRNAGSSTMTKKRIDLGGGNYCFQNSGIQTANDGSCWGIDSFPLAANTQFTISCEARLTEGTEGYAGFCVYGSTPNGGYDKIDKNYCVTSLNNNWKVCYLVFTTNSNTTRNIYIGATTGSTNATIQIRNIKIEIGDHPTPWAPKETDPEYTILGYNSNIEPDCSGYKRDGIVTGTITGNTDTLRYRTCSNITNNSSYIKTENLITTGFENSYSFSWWAKVPNYNNMHWGFANGIRLNGMYTGKLWNTGDSSNNPIYQPGTTTQITVPSANIWHHFVMTGDGTSCKLYVDGKHYGTAKTYKKISGTTLIINGWDTGTSYSGQINISDFRIYCTALSADNVKALYEDAGYVDNQGNFHAYEYSEF